MNGYSTNSSVNIQSAAGTFQPSDTSPVVLDYTSPTWSLKSFNFDATDNIFTGDATASTNLNNTIVGANQQFTISFWARRLTAGVTQILFCRDKSSVAQDRQFIVFFSATDKFSVTLFDSLVANNIAYVSTASFTETREWNQWTIVYDGTAAAASRLTVYRNAITVAGTTTQNGVFSSIKDTTAPAVNIGGRSDAANFASAYLNQLALFDTNLSAASVATLFNKRVPFDIRTNSALNANLIMFLSADTSAVFSTNWAWTDLSGGAVFTSAGMVAADQVADAPALQQVSVVMLHGQSNASGRVPMANLPGRLTGSLSWLKVFDGTTFVNINSTTNNNQYSDTAADNQYGIEFYLGERLNSTYRKTIYLFKQVQGASYLYDESPSWSRNPERVQYTELKNDIIALKEWELDEGFTITKLRFIWQQGEGDSTDATFANAYEAAWALWLTGASNSVFSETATSGGLLMSRFYIQPILYDTTIGANQTTNVPYKATVNTAKTNVQATDTTNYRLYNTDSATIINESGTYIHFDDAGCATIAAGIHALIVTDGL